MRMFKMQNDSKIEARAKIGTIVFECVKSDYGLSIDDESMTGIPHISCTLNRDGDYPFFTVPVTDLIEL